jgi:tripartite ATP-independent transporter DctM subunit
MILLTLVVLLIVFILLGMEIAWAIGLTGFICIALSQYTDNPQPFVVFAHEMTSGINSFTLLSVPLFIFAGELLTLSGATKRLVDLAGAVVGHMHGGLANVAVTANFVVSGMSGSAMADAAATGVVLVPEMQRRNYPVAYACAVVACAATVGPLVPPSLLFIVLGAAVNLSVGRLFLAGIVPAFVLFLAMYGLTYVLARRRGYPREPKAPWRSRLRTILVGLPPLAAPAFVVASMVGGIATPTEAAAIAVFYTLILGAVVYRTLSVRKVIDCAGRSALIATAVMLTVATSQIFSALVVNEQFGDLLTSTMLSISHNANVLLLMVNVLLLALGMFMEPLPIVLVLAPLLVPMMQQQGVDPVHFGVVMVLNLMVGLIHPPVGMNLFVVSAIGRVEVMDVFFQAIPYMISLIVVLIAVTYIPQVSLFLPNLVMGRG